MRRLQIGMWHGLDLDHWSNCGSEKITGLEISQYNNEDELANLAAFCQSHALAFGIHTPVFMNKEYILPKVTSTLSLEREEAFVRIREEVAVASQYGADYILFHYPFPSIFPSIKEPGYFARLPQFEHYESGDGIRSGEFKEWSDRLFHYLSDLQVKYNQRIVLEYDFFGEFGGLFTEMFAQYRDIQLVADVQRLDGHKRVFPGFDPFPWLNAVSSFVYLVHYSNTRYGDTQFHRHLPVLMEQSSDPNYGDAYHYLKYLAQRNDRFHVTFEHNPHLVSRQELLACYELADSVLKNKAV